MVCQVKNDGVGKIIYLTKQSGFLYKGTMNPLTIIYKLRLKGYTQTGLANKLGVSKQLLRAAIIGNPSRGKSKEIRDQIDSILNQ